MARKPGRRPTAREALAPRRAGGRRVLAVLRLVPIAVATLLVASVLALRFVPPPTTWTIASEARRLGGVDRDWVAMSEIAPVMARSVVAAEDARFCRHWGFDIAAIRSAIAAGGNRGASTITQQVVKNVWLWQGRSWLRKALEALVTPLVELAWPKRRILEVYLNVAEFDAGVFGVAAAARHYFGTEAAALDAMQAARLAAVLPDPKRLSASDPTAALDRRASSIRDGAATIARDGRAACFERRGGAPPPAPEG